MSYSKESEQGLKVKKFLILAVLKNHLGNKQNKTVPRQIGQDILG